VRVCMRESVYACVWCEIERVRVRERGSEKERERMRENIKTPFPCERKKANWLKSS